MAGEQTVGVWERVSSDLRGDESQSEGTVVWDRSLSALVIGSA